MVVAAVLAVSPGGPVRQCARSNAPCTTRRRAAARALPNAAAAVAAVLAVSPGGPVCQCARSNAPCTTRSPGSNPAPCGGTSTPRRTCSALARRRRWWRCVRAALCVSVDAETARQTTKDKFMLHIKAYLRLWHTLASDRHSRTYIDANTGRC